MVDEDAFKALIHEDLAFQTYLERAGVDTVRDQLNKMNMKIATQLAYHGDERPAWYKKTKSLHAVVRVRLEEVKVYEEDSIADWKELVVEFVTAIAGHGGNQSKRYPDLDDIDDLYAWLDETGM